MNIRSWTNSRCLLLFLNSADGSSNFDTNNDIINITIFIFLHTRCSSTNPPTQWWKLDRIRLMPTAYTKFRQLLLHIFANDTSFNACHHVIAIDPFNFVHSCHINWDNSSFLLWSEQEWLCDISATSKRYQYNIVCLCHFDKMLCLLVADYVDNIVNSSWQFRVAEHE